MLFAEKRKEVLETARRMEKYGLVRMSGGNVSLRIGETVLVTPSAMPYDSMDIDDIVAVDLQGNILEGNRRPTSDLKAILYILNHMPEVNAVIHTHQPKAVALSLVADRLPIISTTMVDEVKGEVPVAPFTISSDEGMGIKTVEYAEKALCVILKNHGIMAYGKDLEQALCSAVYLEESCAVYLDALATGKEIAVLSREQAEAEDVPRGNYGQQ
ncbi:MAG: class II aldolase/adducin family protein [Erysipelotrichaceae bacterium]|nr:class II aldolase/adducin family protein [Erysipelotrichaceae bacterium]